MAEARGKSRQVRRAEARKKGPERESFRLDRLVPLLLVAAGLFAYGNSLQGPFVLDDLHSIQDNPTIRTLWPPWGALSPPPQSALTGRPIANLSFAFNYAFGSLAVESYHAFNLALHILSALILFGIVRRTLRSPRLRSRHPDGAAGIATAVALLWVVHPLTTESVDYTIQRTELLMGLFFLLTLYGAIRFFEPPGRWGWCAAALTAFVLGLGSKEIIVVAPAIVLVYDWLFWSTSLADALRRHRALYFGFAISLVLFVLVVGTRLRRAFTGLGRRMSPWDYGLMQLGVIVHYLRLAIWPRPLVADYAGWPVPASVAAVLPSLIVVASLIAVTLWGLIRRAPLAFLGVWFFAILAPTSSVRPISTEIAAERRMYLPLAAVVVLLVLAGYKLFRWAGAPRAADIVLVALVSVVLTLMTVRRNEDYRTTFSFWSDIVAKRPNNPRAREWLGQYFYDHGRMAEAYEHFSTAVRLVPKDGLAHFGLATVLEGQGKKDEAIDRYRISLRVDPRNPSPHNNLGAALARRGLTDEAMSHYREAIRLKPDYAAAHYNLGLVLAMRNRGEAIEHFETALRLRPDFPSARRALENLRKSLTP